MGRKLLLCYKVQFALNQVIAEIRSKGTTRYAFLPRARNLLWAILCQALLNDPKLDDHMENYGQSLTIEAGYRSTIERMDEIQVAIRGQRKVEPPSALERAGIVRSNGYGDRVRRTSSDPRHPPLLHAWGRAKSWLTSLLGRPGRASSCSESGSVLAFWY